MRINRKNIALANELRSVVQSRTEQIDDGEAVAMVLLWSFLMDHAACEGMDVEHLAREQLDAFISYARGKIQLARAQ